MPLFVDQGQADDLRANTAIAQAKDDWYNQTAPDRAVDQTRTDYYNTRAADDAIAQVRSDYYQQRAGVLGDVAYSPPTQSAGVTDAVPTPASESAAVSSPPVAGTPPADSGLPAPNDPVTTPLVAPGQGGKFSPYDDTFRKYAGDLANNDEFISMVAAGTKAESQWNTNSTTGDGGHSWGLFQMHDHGMGAGMGNSRLDPDAASAVMVPRYADAYRRFKAQGLSGAQLAAAVGHAAEMNADASGSGYAKAWNDIMGGATNFVSNAASAVGNFMSGVGGAVKAAATDPSAGPAGIGINAAKQYVQGNWDANQRAIELMQKATAPPMMQDDQSKYALQPWDSPRLTPDEQKWLQDYYVQQAQVFAGGGPGEGRPLFGRGGVPGADVGRNPLPAPTQPQDLENALQQSQYQIIVNQIRKLGWSDDQIAKSLRDQGVPDDTINSLLNPPEANPVESAAPEAAPAPQATAAESPVTPADTGQTAPPPQATGTTASIAPSEIGPPTPPSFPPDEAPFPTDGSAPPPPPNRIGQAFDMLNETKRSIYALSNVHAMNITKALATSEGGPQASADFLKNYVSAMAKGNLEDAMDSEDMRQWFTDAARNGVNFPRGNPEVGEPLASPLVTRLIGGAATGVASGAATYLAQKDNPDRTRNAFIAGGVGAVLGATAAGRMHDALFQDALPVAKTMLYKSAVEGGSSGPEAAQYVNNLLGGQNLEKVFGSPTMAAIARFALQAPDWLVSESKLAGGAARGAFPGASQSEVMSRNWWMKTMLTYGLATEAIQLATTGHLTVPVPGATGALAEGNSPGSEFQVEIPTGQNAPNGKPANMTFGLFPGEAQQVLDAGARTVDSPVQGALTTGEDRINRLAMTGFEELFNQQYPGGPQITTPTQKVFGKVRLGDDDATAAQKRAEFAAGQFSPISVSGSEREAQYGAPLPLVALSTLFGQQMGANTRQQRMPIRAPAPGQGAPTPTLVRSGAPAPTAGPARTRLDLLRQKVRPTPGPE